MKKTGILNQNILTLIGSLGHTDRFTVCDAGLTIDRKTERIDLAVTKGSIPFLDVLKPLLDEIVVEKIILAHEIKDKSPVMYREIVRLAGSIPIEEVSHEDFKKLSYQTKAVIRTGECTPYTNVILQSGVNFS